VPPSPVRPMPKGIMRKAQSPRRQSFRLFDKRKCFTDEDKVSARPGPRIRIIDELDPRSVFLSQFVSHRSSADNKVDAQKFGRRLTALKLALDNLPLQARRLVRWQARRAAMKVPGFTTPMRPGPPPGHLKKPKDDIDHVLKECHGLAWLALRADTS
jgi:hypothetical protein